MNWIYDECTEHSRLMVGIDRQGITVRCWSEADEPEYYVQEGFYTWEQYRKRTRTYAGDLGQGRMVKRLVDGALSLLETGNSSDNSGFVPSLNHYVNGHHVLTC